MRYKITELLDIEKITQLLENFSKTTGIVTAILDLEGNILCGAGWIDLCSCFHRISPQSAIRCRKSDTILSLRVNEGEKYAVYKCLNGLIDVAVPIHVSGHHVGNLFTGQFLFEKPDLDFFRQQAIEYDFDVEAYMEAVAHVKVFTEDEVKSQMLFLTLLTESLAEMGLANLNQLEVLAKLKQSENRYRRLINSMSAGFALHKIICDKNDTPINYLFLEVNDQFEKLTGLKKNEVVGKTVMEILPNTEMVWVEQYGQVALTGKPIVFNSYSKELGRHFETVAYSPQARQFATIFTDITERKKAEESLSKQQDSLGDIVAEKTEGLRKIINSMAGREIRMAELKKENEELKKRLSAIDLES